MGNSGRILWNPWPFHPFRRPRNGTPTQKHRGMANIRTTNVSPTRKGKVERDMGFWSPIGDSPFGNRLPKGHQLVTKHSLVMPIPLIIITLLFRPDHVLNYTSISIDVYLQDINGPTSVIAGMCIVTACGKAVTPGLRYKIPVFSDPAPGNLSHYL